MDCGKCITIFLVWMPGLKVSENSPFWHLCRCEVRQNILAMCNDVRRKIRKSWGEIDHCHQYQPLIIYWTVTLLLYIFMIRHYFTFSAVWSHMTQVQVWCLKHYFRAIFVDAFWKGPLTPEIFTSTIILSFLSNWWVTSYRVIPNCSYKVIKHQILWCRKYMKIRIFIWLF